MQAKDEIDKTKTIEKEMFRDNLSQIRGKK